MKKTNIRRLRNLGRTYSEIVARGDIESFNGAWEQRMSGWLYEIERRVKLQRKKLGTLATSRSGQLTMRYPKTEIFDVLDSANRLLNACGKEVERLVGEDTRTTLANECANAVAHIYDRRLYRPVTTDIYDRKY